MTLGLRPRLPRGLALRAAHRLRLGALGRLLLLGRAGEGRAGEGGQGRRGAACGQRGGQARGGAWVEGRGSFRLSELDGRLLRCAKEVSTEKDAKGMYVFRD